MLVRMCSKAVIAEEGFARTLEMATNLTQQSPPEGIYMYMYIHVYADAKYLYHKVYSRVISARLSSIYSSLPEATHLCIFNTQLCGVYVIHISSYSFFPSELQCTCMCYMIVYYLQICSVYYVMTLAL